MFNEIVEWKALETKVIAVLIKRVDGWAAYIGSVPGVCHKNEIALVAQQGAKLPEKIALAIFPNADNYGEYCP